MNRSKPSFGACGSSARAPAADGQQPGGPLLEAAGDLTRRLRDGPAHLPAQLGAELVGPVDHPRHERLEQGDPLGQRHRPPRPLGGDGAVEDGVDGGLVGQLALDVDGAVDRRDRLLQRHRHESGRARRASLNRRAPTSRLPSGAPSQRYEPDRAEPDQRRSSWPSPS